MIEPSKDIACSPITQLSVFCSVLTASSPAENPAEYLYSSLETESDPTRQESLSYKIKKD